MSLKVHHIVYKDPSAFVLKLMLRHHCNIQLKHGTIEATHDMIRETTSIAVIYWVYFYYTLCVGIYSWRFDGGIRYSMNVHWDSMVPVFIECVTWSDSPLAIYPLQIHDSVIERSRDKISDLFKITPYTAFLILLSSLALKLTFFKAVMTNTNLFQCVWIIIVMNKFYYY